MPNLSSDRWREINIVTLLISLFLKQILPGHLSGLHNRDSLVAPRQALPLFDGGGLVHER